MSCMTRLMTFQGQSKEGVSLGEVHQQSQAVSQSVHEPGLSCKGHIAAS